MMVNEIFDASAKLKRNRAQVITICRPDDWHVHLRDHALLKAILPYTAAQFSRGLIMPNLAPPITTVGEAAAYRARILEARHAQSDFEPLMSCYLTDTIAPDEIENGYTTRIWIAAKLYPHGVTTNAHNGVTRIENIRTTLERMERIGMPLLVHAETADASVDIFDREAVFLERTLLPIIRDHQGLKVVIEHATTKEAIEVVRANAGRLAATITPHHLMINRSSLFEGGLRPHLYCLPVAKREHHRLALRQAATSGEPNFFIGTDSAPHLSRSKESACGCAGIFVGATALQTYAQVFDEEDALEHLEAFASLNGARFYGLPANVGKLRLSKTATTAPLSISVDNDEVVVFRGGLSLPWSVLEQIEQ